MVCVQCETTIQQDDARVLAASKEIKEALNSIEKQQQQFAELSPEQLQPDPSIPITFTKASFVKFQPYLCLYTLLAVSHTNLCKRTEQYYIFIL